MKERPNIEQCHKCRAIKRYMQKKDASGKIIKVCDVCKGLGYLVKK